MGQRGRERSRQRLHRVVLWGSERSRPQLARPRRSAPLAHTCNVLLCSWACSLQRPSSPWCTIREAAPQGTSPKGPAPAAPPHLASPSTTPPSNNNRRRAPSSTRLPLIVQPKTSPAPSASLGQPQAGRPPHAVGSLQVLCRRRKIAVRGAGRPALAHRAAACRRAA